MLVVMIVCVVVGVIMRMCCFGLLFSSFVCLCHLSRGQNHAFRRSSVYAASSLISGQRGLRLSTTVRVFDVEGQT